jgi:CheY-like chemotaxis protein
MRQGYSTPFSLENFRHGLRRLIAETNGLRLLGVCPSGVYPTPLRRQSRRLKLLKTQGSDRPGILDLKMPKRSGFDVLAFIRESPEFRHLETHMFTGSRDPDMIDKALAAGAKRVVEKPDRLMGFIGFVEEVVSPGR